MQQQQQQQMPFQQPKIIEPPENIKEIIKKTINIFREQGFEKEEQLKHEHANDPNYQFLFFPTQYFWYYQEMKGQLIQELMQKTQQKFFQGGMPPGAIPMHHPPHHGHLPPPGMLPMQMNPPPQGVMHPHLPPPHIQHMQFIGQNGQFQQQQQQQQNSQGIQMLPPQPNMQMMPPIQNQNQPIPPILPPPPMFNPQFMNQFPPLNNQQGQNLPSPLPPPQMPPPMSQNSQQFNMRQLSPNNQHLMPGFHPQMHQQIPQQHYQDFMQQQQQHQNLNMPQQPNGFANNLVFNPSQQQLQQQHEIHLQKIQKDDSNKKRTRWGDQVQMVNNLTPQQLNQQHFIMPGTTQSGGNLNQRRIVLNSKNPEMLSGSLMAELVKQNNRKIVEQLGKFKKYQPINPQNVPDYLYIENKDSSSLKSKLNSLLDYADDIREQEIKSMEKRKKERERELELKKMEEQGIDTYELRNPEKKSSTKRNIEKEIEELYGVQKGEMMNLEMGIRPDGRVAGPQVYGLGSGGFSAPNVGASQDNVFSAFRMARSKNYHSTAEERSQFRDKGSDLCYKCSRPGHIARECKYGMS